MTATTWDSRPSVRLLLLAISAALVLALAGCGGNPADRAASETSEINQPRPTSAQGAIAPPTTNAEGGFGLPKAQEITSLGIPGVTEATFPETCEIELVARDEAIGFAVGSAVVPPEGQENLELIASSRLVGAESVSVVGHTSSEGDPAFNQRLSEERAAAVRAVLTPLVSGASFTSEGRGPSELVYAPDGTEDRAASRRVVITAQVPEETCSTFGSSPGG